MKNLLPQFLYLLLGAAPVMIMSNAPVIQQENGIDFIQLSADRHWCGAISFAPKKFPAPVHNPGHATALKLISQRVSRIEYYTNISERENEYFGYTNRQALPEIPHEVKQPLGEAHIFPFPEFQPFANHFNPSGFSQEYQLPIEYRVTFGKGNANISVLRKLLGWDSKTAYYVESSENGQAARRYLQPYSSNSHFRIYLKGIEQLENGDWTDIGYLPVAEYLNFSVRHNVPCWLGPAGPNAPLEPLNMRMFTGE